MRRYTVALALIMAWQIVSAGPLDAEASPDWIRGAWSGTVEHENGGVWPVELTIESASEGSITKLACRRRLSFSEVKRGAAFFREQSGETESKCSELGSWALVLEQHEGPNRLSTLWYGRNGRPAARGTLNRTRAAAPPATTLDAQTPATAGQGQAPAALAQQIVTDFQGEDWLQDLHGGDIAALAKTLEVTDKDLNGDGRGELLVFANDSGKCGTGGCAMWIYRRTTRGYESISEEVGPASEFQIGLATNLGYRDIRIGGNTLRFNGRSYVLVDATSPDTVDPVVFPSDPQEAARAFWKRRITRCGESYFAAQYDYNDRLEYVHEYRGVTFKMDADRMTDADRLNGTEWRGRAYLVSSARRAHSGSSGWTRWATADDLANRFTMTKENGSWTFQSNNLIRFRGIDCKDIPR